MKTSFCSITTSCVKLRGWIYKVDV